MVQAPWHVVQEAVITTYQVPVADTFNLMGGAENSDKKKTKVR